MKKILACLLSAAFMMLSLCACAEEKSSVTLGNVVVFGDSYSTFKGKIPEGYAAYYSKSSYSFGVTSHKKTWWYKVVDRTNSNLLLNSSYSGTTICHTGYDGADYSEISFAARMEVLVNSGYFAENRVDTLLILGGLNDYWAKSPVGEIKYEGITVDDLYNVYPAFAYMLALVREASPETRIIYISEEYLPEDMKASLHEICACYGAEVVEMKGISKKDGHPDAAGMETMADRIIEYLEIKR